MAQSVVRGSDGISRCWWAAGSESYGAYHDEEWGRPTRDDRWIFVGPTTVYAFMQAAGIVNDHMHGCVAQKGCDGARQKFKAPRTSKR